MQNNTPSPPKPLFGVLTNNQLKIIAMISMALDHIGLILFPQFRIFRILGRIAFSIFAYMIAEGCRYTQNRAKYLAVIAAMGVAFQLVYFFLLGDLYQGILVTFSLAIIAIYSIEGLFRSHGIGKRLLSLAALAFVAVFGGVFPVIFADAGFAIDYDLWGYFASRGDLLSAKQTLASGQPVCSSAHPWRSLRRPWRYAPMVASPGSSDVGALQLQARQGKNEICVLHLLSCSFGHPLWHLLSHSNAEIIRSPSSPHRERIFFFTSGINYAIMKKSPIFITHFQNFRYYYG